MKNPVRTGIFLAVLAAALYAINAPCSKLLLDYLPPTLTAGFLYLGAGLGMAFIALIRKLNGKPRTEARLTKAELPYTIAMIVLDIAAPVCLLFGLRSTTAANASLLNNFEIVATAVIAFAAFREAISPRLWTGIAFVTLACLLLSFEDLSSLQFSYGSLLILLACVCWGLENNCTRKISSKDPMEIVLLKGIFSGSGSVVIGLCAGERAEVWWSVLAVLAVGLVAYGLSIFFYVYAQRLLGAARTSAYYAVAPFLGTLLSLAVFREMPPYTYFAAFALMAVGAWLCADDKPLFRKKRAPVSDGAEHAIDNRAEIDYNKGYAECTNAFPPQEDKDMSLTLRQVQENELGELAVLSARLWRTAYGQLLGEEQIAYMLDRFQNEKAFREQIAGGYRYYYVTDGGEILGYTGVCPREGGEFFLSKLYFDPSAQGKGYGQAGLAAVAALAKEAGCDRVTLTVNKGNDRAVRAYKRFGFSTVREEKTDIGGGFYMDDFVMEYRF